MQKLLPIALIVAILLVVSNLWLPYVWVEHDPRQWGTDVAGPAAGIAILLAWANLINAMRRF